MTIEVEDLTKRYGDVSALDGVSFGVDAGQLVAVLGPNGVGKTTMVEILEGFRSRTAGHVRVVGHDPAAPGRDFRERIGVVLQHHEPEPYLDVIELVDLYRGYYRKPAPAGEILDLVGLASHARTRIRHLSGGQRRRLDFALALTGDPEVVFLDEPTTGFDPEARRSAWDAIRSLTSMGKTVVLTTHYLEEAEALADRVLVLSHGRVVADDSPSGLRARHRASCRASFSSPTGVAPSDAPLPVTVTAGRWSVDIGVTRQLHVLTSWAVERDVALEHLSLERPLLEDVYLELTQ